MNAVDKKSLNVLLVEDNEGDARLIREAVKENGVNQVEVKHAKRLSEALECMGSLGTDVVLLDLGLPDSQGLETLSRACQAARGIPIIVLTGRNDEALALDTVRGGAEDYLVKGQFDAHALLRSIRYSIERRLFRDALRRSQERLARTEAFSLMMVSHVGLDGRWLQVPQTLCQLLGYSEEEMLSTSAVDATHPDDRAADLSQRARLIRGETKSFELEKRYIRKDGQPVWVYLNCTVVLDDAGNPFHFLTHVRDITDRKRADEVRGRLAAVVESSDDAIMTKTLDGVITTWNQSAERIFGYAQREVLGKPGTMLIPPELRHEEPAIFEKMLRGQRIEQFETRRLRKDGSAVDVSITVSPLRDATGRVVGASKIARDITARKRADETLKRSELELREAQKIAGLGRWEYDPSSGLVTWSEEVYRIFGLETRDFAGTYQTYLERVHPQDRERLAAAVEATLREGKPYAIDHRIVLPDGTTRYLTARGELHRAPGGVVKLRGTVLDITDRKRMEEQLVQAQKTEAVGRLAGGVAHDFNNLLTVIGGYTSLALQRISSSDPSHADLTEVVKASDRAAGLTRQLLAFSRKQMLSPTVMNLNAVVKDMERMLRRLIEERIDLASRLDPELGSIRVDAGQMEQVIMNLAVNARDAMPKGGKLLIETANVTLDEDFVATHPGSTKGPHVVLSVSDNGTGMDRETLSHLFEPFFTTKEPGKGTGLGLATVYGIVKQSGGYVRAYSEPGHGTSFKVYLPRVGEVASGTRVTRRNGVSRGTETILLVEDEVALRMLAGKILASQGYTVLTAALPGEALAIAGKHSGKVHLLVTDVVMPEMSGSELSQQLLKGDPSMKVLYVSGYSETMASDHVVLEDGRGFLQKPFTADALLGRIRKLLDGEGQKAPLLSR